MPREVFIAGQILTAAEMNSVSDQTVMVFAGTAARGSAIPTPTEGMVTYLSDSNLVEAYTGAAFKPVSEILQVVSTAKTNTFSTSSTSFTDVTGLSATITPRSTSSKIMVMGHINLSPGSGTSDSAYIAFSGGNSATYIGDAAGNRVRAAGMVRNDSGLLTSVQSSAHSPMYLDSPNTTSPVTYNVQMRMNSGTGVINGAGSDADANTRGRLASSITLIEVAG